MKSKKIYILILTGIYIFFISIFNVKALSYTVQVGGNQVHSFTDGGEITKIRNFGITGLLGNHLNGFLFFNLGVGGPIEIYSISAYVDNRAYACDMGTGTTYNDNTGQRIFMGVTCPVDIKNGESLSQIVIRGYGNAAGTSKYIFWPQTLTYYSYYMESSNTQNIQNNTQNIDTNTNDIKNKMNEDITSSDKQAPDQTEYNNAKQQEDNIIQSISNVSANDITFNQDLNATNKIWDTTTRFLQTNAKVMGLVISILSIGIIKLIMNR